MRLVLKRIHYKDEYGRDNVRKKLVLVRSPRRSSSARGSSARRSRRRTRRGGFFRKAVLFVCLILVAAVAAGVIYGSGIVKKATASLDKLSRKDIGSTREELLISDNAYEDMKGTNTVNIALFGKDVEDDGLQRSDSILILSVNMDTGGMKLVSIQRDTFVPIPGYEDLYKINSAYMFGEDALAVRTLNRNFDMNISRFVTIDMEALCDIVDALGGIELTLSEEERVELNRYLDDINFRLGGPQSPYIQSPGTVLCDGRQALTYARIRSLGNSDFDRTARQRVLLDTVFRKLMKAVGDKNIRLLLRVIDAASAHITTNMTDADILRIAMKVVRGDRTLTACSLSDPSYLKLGYVEDDMEALVPDDLTDMAYALHRILFGDSFVYDPSPEQIGASEMITDYIYYYGVELYEIDTGSTI